MCRPERPNVESKQRKLSLGKIGKLILQWFTLKWILSLWIQLFFYGLPAVTSQVITVIFLNYCSMPGCRFLTNFPTNPSPFGQPFMSDTINISKTHVKCPCDHLPRMGSEKKWKRWTSVVERDRTSGPCLTWPTFQTAYFSCYLQPLNLSSKSSSGLKLCCTDFVLSFLRSRETPRRSVKDRWVSWVCYTDYSAPIDCGM